MRVQHLLDALTPGHKSTVLEQLCGLAALLAHGSAPDALAPHLAGAKLFAASKKDGRSGPSPSGKPFTDW